MSLLLKFPSEFQPPSVVNTRALVCVCVIGSWPFFLAQATSAVEAGTSASAPSSSEPPLMEPVPNDAPGADTSLLTGSDAPSLRARISLLEGKILDLQRELRVQGNVARRASADKDFMLSEINKAAEQLVCEYS